MRPLPFHVRVSHACANAGRCESGERCPQCGVGGSRVRVCGRPPLARAADDPHTTRSYRSFLETSSRMPATSDRKMSVHTPNAVVLSLVPL